MKNLYLISTSLTVATKYQTAKLGMGEMSNHGMTTRVLTMPLVKETRFFYHVMLGDGTVQRIRKTTLKQIVQPKQAKNSSQRVCYAMWIGQESYSFIYDYRQELEKVVTNKVNEYINTTNNIYSTYMKRNLTLPKELYINYLRVE